MGLSLVICVVFRLFFCLRGEWYLLWETSPPRVNVSARGEHGLFELVDELSGISM